MEGTRVRLCTGALHCTRALQFANRLRDSHSSNYHTRDCLWDPCVELLSRSQTQSTPEDFCLLQSCLGDRLSFCGFTHRTMESLAPTGFTFRVLVATRKSDPTHGEGLLWKTHISAYVVLGRSGLSRGPSRSGTVSVEDLTC